MRTNFLRLSLLGLASCSLLASCADFDAGEFTETTAPNGAVIIHGDGPMTPPTSAARAQVVRDFLKSRGAGIATEQLAVTREISGTSGVTHVMMEQTIDGMRVEGAYAKAAIDANGSLLQMIDNVARPGAHPTKLQVTAQEALVKVFDELALGQPGTEIGSVGMKTFFEPGTDFYREPSAERVVYLDDAKVARQGFLVETWFRADNQLEHTLVGFDGAIVSTETRTSADSYNVFTEDPGKGAQTTVAGPGGWLGAGAQTTTNITGNNAHAYLDVDANNAPDAGGTAVTDGNFTTAVDLSQSPKTAGNRNVAVQNLFYFNNVVHDALYAAGFNEAAGNFQTNNFGLGGAGNDPVNAEAQDGSGTDNANFSTPADGSSPRMQMYLWTPKGDHQVVVGSTTYLAAGAAFGTALTTTGLTGSFAVASPADGCAAVSGVSGKIAIIDRGTCDFVTKVMNAQTAGATGVIIANNASDSVFTMGGTNRKIKISSVMVGLADGAALKGAASGTIRKSPTPPPQLDGDVDADIVFHEYGHGLTWRMIGSMSGTIAGALGEGASDVNAIFLNGDDLIGEYSYADLANGIRRHRYEGYDLSYNDICVGGCEVHNDGEIYGAIMWEFRKNGLAAGVSNNDLYKLWVQGMNYTPAGPSYENMRDGLLQSIASSSFSSTLTCVAWNAFAKYGVGVGSSAVSGMRRGQTTVTITESNAVPATCQ
ncbi:MAG TPA: M36 family metallopeptidase [Kofleriaceae bacterium]|nr:M36 family metallopeptidase [Kofleriaceae bacterium]